MSTRKVSKLAAAVSVPALLVAGCIAAQGASASGSASKASCDGVRLLAAPLPRGRVADVTIDISGPVDDLVRCQPVSLIRSARATARAASGDCENAQVFGPGSSRGSRPRRSAVLINVERRAQGLGDLGAQRTLKKAAKRHSSQMVSAGCFSHTCPGEPDLVGRVTSAGYLPCSCSWSVGENIAWGRALSRSRSSGSAATVASTDRRWLRGRHAVSRAITVAVHSSIRPARHAAQVCGSSVGTIRTRLRWRRPR